MTDRSKTWMAWIGVLAVAAVAFAVVRLTGSGSPAGDDQEPAPEEEVQPPVAEEETEPLFVGEMNGIVFKEKVTREEVGCTAPTERADVAEARAALPFSLGYLPAGFELVEEAGTQCGDKILAYYQIYEGPRGQIEIARHNGLAVETIAPVDRMKSIDLDGVSAVLVEEERALSSAGPWRLYIPHQGTITEIVGRGMPLDECLRIAQELKIDGGTVEE